jgi:mono/diheme cytochrome c family protein
MPACSDKELKMHHRLKNFATVVLAVAGGVAGLGGIAGPTLAQAKPDLLRGELLYSTHCIACHNAQLHWRDKKVAKDWSSLQAEVERWQKITGLGWREEDVTGVARYLNGLYYRFPEPQAASALAAQTTDSR